MPTRDPQAVLQQLGRTTFKVDTYFLRRTGFVANQTILKLGEYSLNCVPATLGLEESRFLAVLTPVEANHFVRFKEGTHVLVLTFDDPENKDVARYHLRVALLDLVPVPDRKNVCFLLLKIKSIPPELISFLGDYHEALEARKAAWESQTGAIKLPPGPLLALDSRAFIAADSHKVPVIITEFDTKWVKLTWTESVESWSVRPAVHLRLSVRGQPLVLEGRLDAEGTFLPEFNTEWLDLVEELRFQKTLKHRPGTRTDE